MVRLTCGRNTVICPSLDGQEQQCSEGSRAEKPIGGGRRKEKKKLRRTVDREETND